MADFYTARDTTMTPLPWPSIAPPFTSLSTVNVGMLLTNSMGRLINTDIPIKATRDPFSSLLKFNSAVLGNQNDLIKLWKFDEFLEPHSTPLSSTIMHAIYARAHFRIRTSHDED